MRVEGIDGRKVFMEAELDSGGDESQSTAVRVEEAMARRRERRADERWG